MDPLSAFSIVTGIITFVDFGAKLVSLYLEVQKSEAGRPEALSALDTESRELSGNASGARDRIASLQARYPRQAASLARLAAECAQVETELRILTDSLTVTVRSGGGRSHGLRAFAVAIRTKFRQDDIDRLQGGLRSIREQVMMNLIMCISDDAIESRAKLAGVDEGVGEVLNVLRPIQKAIINLQPEFSNVSRGQPLATALEREKMASGLWTSITTADQPDFQLPPVINENPVQDDGPIHRRILRSLEFEDMTARGRQIETPFPETFQWLLADQGPESTNSVATAPIKFKEWLESQTNDAPFWITGKPASGKSTLMKFIATTPGIETHLQAWAGGFRLLICSVYFWNPGSSLQKSQAGLLSTILHQLLKQRPDLCHRVAWKRHLYFQLAGTDAPEPPDWTIAELGDSVIQFVSQTEGTDRLALFVDGLDEYEGDFDSLLSFFKQLHRDCKVKLCVSSRPWNVFQDEFRTYPSLRMELFTRPDIEKYVCARLRSTPAFQELRGLDPASIKDLESQIINKADGVFLWVALVVQKLIESAREYNDLHEIWTIFNSLPPGLEELYASMRRRLDPAHRERASRMYQLVFRWNENIDRPFEALEFWMAINCQDPTTLQPYPNEDQITEILPVLERRLAGATGGILQVHVDDRLLPTSIGFLHRTVFDWLQSVRSSVENDGPAGYDPGLVLTSILVSNWNRSDNTGAIITAKLKVNDIFKVGRSCRNSPETRSKLLRIIDQLHPVPPGVWIGDAYGMHVIMNSLSRRQMAELFPDTMIRPMLAACQFCAPYLQAKLESSSHSTGLELPRILHLLPEVFWGEPYRTVTNILFRKLANVPVADLLDNTTLNAMLKTIEVLVQARFAPRRVWAASFNQLNRVENEEFTTALQAVLKGKKWIELPE
ncbi:hypothetical protein B0H66DRAFT_347710 [Apodospora peruviana]|uniref:NACHT domain-containing protein n=1 Tax=Apodospora peruviana TaxID=516989 RepID=A0AAE0HZF4_9PEZI|nr:hypothetical protein B0H66DRAFT_347710 [Apodospora peruviana]